MPEQPEVVVRKTFTPGAAETAAAPDHRRRGLDHRKYRVERTDGKPGLPDDRFFVLRYSKDPHAAVATLAYAEAVAATHPLLAADLLFELRSVKPAADSEAFRIRIRTTVSALCRQFPEVGERYARREANPS